VISEDTYHVEWTELSTEQVSDDGFTIKDVILCGNRSRNGYEIPASAFKDVRRLYEAKPVFLDHAADPKDSGRRSLRDMCGIVRNARMVGTRPVGDIDTQGFAEGVNLLQLARRRLPGVGMSHAASYRFDKSRKVVQEVKEVLSVDCVFRPATTASLFEETADRLILEHELDNLRVRLGLSLEENAALKAKLNQSQFMVRRAAEKMTVGEFMGRSGRSAFQC